MSGIRLNRKYYLPALFLIFCLESYAQVFDVVVDKGGHGNFSTVQAALNSIPNNLTGRTLVFIKNGIYTEKVVLPASKTNVSLIGESPEGAIISWDDNPTKGLSAADTYTFWADGPGLYAENLTIRNTSGNVGQAIAIRTTGDTMVFKNCRFLGFQDTYYAHKRRQYNLKCTVEGGTDFIYGDATTVFDSCTIRCVKGGQYISAPADTKLVTQLTGANFLHGLLFRFCDVTAETGVSDNSYYLGRPWQPNASSVYIQCTLGPHIKPEGWATWGNDNHLSSYFAEYHSRKPDGEPVDISQRANWSYQVSDAWAANLYKLSFFLRKDGVIWNPSRITSAPQPPLNFTESKGFLSWDAVPEAIGYVVLRNDSAIGFSKSAFFTDTGYTQSTHYSVKSVGINGNLSKSTDDFATGLNMPAQSGSLQISVSPDGLIRLSKNVEFRVFTVNGQIVSEGTGTTIRLQKPWKGIFLIQATGADGNMLIKKAIL